MTRAGAIPAILAMLAAVGLGVLGWLDYSDRHAVEGYFREMYYQRPSEPNYLRPQPDKSAYAKAIERQTSRKGIPGLAYSNNHGRSVLHHCEKEI